MHKIETNSPFHWIFSDAWSKRFVHEQSPARLIRRSGPAIKSVLPWQFTPRGLIYSSIRQYSEMSF